MMSATSTSDARWSSAATPQHTSRSVTTPTSLRVFASSMTGVQPQPDVRMARAACAAVSFGVQHDAVSIGSITSLQQLMCVPFIPEFAANQLFGVSILEPGAFGSMFAIAQTLAR